MAEHLHKDAKAYSEEYLAFIRELKTFHDSRGYVSGHFFFFTRPGLFPSPPPLNGEIGIR